jgi:macrolide-specific efflux system membrane fusion protein
MTMNKKRIAMGAGILAALLLVVWTVKGCRSSGGAAVVEEIHPDIGDIWEVISTTGTVEPQNRLQIKPPIGGRIEEILVREGDMVKEGQTLAWMSSTERAALLDAARSRGPEQVAYWKDAYKAAPLIAPIDAEVIVRAFEPGQTVTAADAVLVLSNRLIVNAQVDETDIGRVKVGQKAVVSLDAYPDVKVASKVEHISYESKVVNNATIYEVDILPDKVPDVFRSGMSALVEIVERQKNGVLRVPVTAVARGRKKTTVTVLEDGREVRREVRLGASDEKYVEIISGLGANDTVVMKKEKKTSPKSSQGTNPFMPGGGRGPR